MSHPATFGSWRRQRPFVGALLLLLAGVELFFSTQLDIGHLHVQMGIEGFQATIIPIGFVLLAVLIAVMPQHRIFYGVIALALSIYSIIGVNLGGFLLGMLLSAVGGILAVSWAPPAPSGSGAAEPVEREPLGVDTPVTAGRDEPVHAEFVPYTALTRQRRKAGVTAAVALLFATALTAAGMVAAPPAEAASLRTAEPAALCLPILMTCPPASPAPSPSPSPSSGGGLGGLVNELLGGAPAASADAPLVIGPDASAYRMTLPAGQLGGSSISISGIHQLGLVTVKKVDGSSFPVIKLQADDVVITGFLLDVRRATGPALVSTADRMELKGNVSVWLDSLTGSTLGGLGLTLGTDQTPPPSSELPPKLLRVNLGLVATQADSITYVNLHQELHG
jgi:hypothetical protein